MMSSLASSQVLSTNNSNKIPEGLFIPKAQVSEVAKGLQQIPYLKARITSAEKALSEAEKLIREQEKDSQNDQKIIKNLNQQILNQQEQALKTEDIYRAEINILNAELKQEKKNTIKVGKKKFWNGFAIGGVTVGILGGATVIYLLSK